MKILQVVPFFTPARGGSAIVPYYLSKELSKIGYEITIITTDFEFDGEYAKSLQEVQVIPFRCVANIGLMLFSPRMKKWLNKKIKGFDIVHLHNFRSYQNNTIHRFAKKYGIPYILQAHGSIPRILEKQKLKMLYDWIFGYRLLSDAAMLIAVSREEVKQYKQIGIDDRKISIVHNGLDISLFKNLPEYGKFKEKHGINDGHLILFLGRIHRIKGLDFLIKSFSDLRKERKDVTLVIAGPDDGYKNKLEKLIWKLRLNEEIKFVGYVSDPLSAYVDADILVYPSIYEIFGLVPFEAIMCNTPVIVTDTCGCGELVKKSGAGYSIQYGDVEGLKEKMKRIIEKPEEGKEMVKRGKKYIEETLAWDKIVREVDKLYKTVLNA